MISWDALKNAKKTILIRPEEEQAAYITKKSHTVKIIQKIVEENGGEAILTKLNHYSGSDRTYEAYSKLLKNDVDLIINLQGDMPNIKPDSISKLEKLMRSSNCDIGTLASKIMDNKQKSIRDKLKKVSLTEYEKRNLFAMENEGIFKDVISCNKTKWN